MKLGVAFVLAVFVLEAQEPSTAVRFTRERTVTVPAAGAHRLAIDSTLLAGAAPFRVMHRGERAIAERGLADLRLFDAQERQVPYILVYPPREPVWVAGALLPIAATKKTSGFEADFGTGKLVDMIRVTGIPAPFLKRLVLEGSGDRAHWTMLAAEGTLFDLPDERLRQTDLGFPSGAYRYLRVTWDDANSGRVPMPRSVLARRSGGTPAPPPSMATLVAERRPSEPGRSRYRLHLPAPRLPIIALDLNIAGGHVFRRAVVTESRFAGEEAAPAQIGSAVLIRIVRDGATASSLRIPIAPPTEPDLELFVDDGNNPPLDIKSVSAVFAELPWIYFEAPGGPLRARYGDVYATAPSYDLEAVRESIDIGSVPEAAWREAREITPVEAGTTASSLPVLGASLDLANFRYTRPNPDRSAGLVALALDVAALTHSRGPSNRFADVRIVDAASRQVPYLLERRDEPLSIDLAVVSVQPGRQILAAQIPSPSGRSRSVYVIKLPFENMPAGSLVLETSARVFQRSVQVGIQRPADRHRRDPSFDVIATGTWRHADQQVAAPALTLRIRPVDTADLLLVVDEGDNATLPIVSARLLLPSYRLRFFHPAEANLRLVYGRDDIAPPEYDLALLAPHVMGATAREIAAGPESGAAQGMTGGFVSARVFWLFLGFAVLALLAIIVRLVRTS